MAKRWYKGELLNDKEYNRKLESENETNMLLLGCAPTFIVIISIFGYIAYLINSYFFDDNDVSLIILAIIALILTVYTSVSAIKRFPNLLRIGTIIVWTLFVCTMLYLIHYLYVENSN